MTERDVSIWLNSKTDKQFIEFFYKHLSQRHLFSGEEAFVDCHLVLAAAVRYFDNDQWDCWKIELLCPTPNESWVDDAPVCQFGMHCEHETASWAKESECPVCSGKVYGT